MPNLARLLVLSVALGGLATLAGCSSEATVTPVPAAATQVAAPSAISSPWPTEERRSIAFVSPSADVEAASPVEVCVRTTGVTLGPTTNPDPGVGHVVVMVDASPQEVQRASGADAPSVPPGPRYVHFDDGGACHSVALEAGHHALFGLLVDSQGVPLNPQNAARMQLTVSP